MPTAGVTHHFTIQNGSDVRGFMQVLGSYSRQRADDFAPRISSGNDTATAQGLWQSWAQTGMSEGVDQYEFANANKVLWTDGNIFGNRDGAVTLDSEWTSSDASKSATAPQIIDFLTDLVLVGVGTKVRRYSISGGTWANSTTTLAANCIWLHKHGAKVYAAVSGSNEIYDSTDGDTWSQSVTTPNGQAATCMETWEVAGGTVYLVIGTANTIKLSSDLGVTFGSAINIGDASSDVTNLKAAFGVLFIRKTDGLYWYNGTSVQEVWRHRETKYSGNVCMAYHNGFLYVNEINKIWKLSISDGSISNFSEVTPRMRGDEAKDLYGHGIPKWMWSGKDGLYVAFDDGESVYPEVMYLNELGGWQQAYRGTSGDTMNAGGYSQLAGRSFINDGATRIRRHVTLADTPFPSYPSSGQFTTSIHLAGYPWVEKAYGVLSLEARNLSSAAGRQITVEYSTDKGTSYTTIGTIDTDGRTQLQFDTSDSAVNAQAMMLRFTLTRGSTSTETPILERWASSFLMRPEPIYAYSVTARIGPELMLMDGTKETYEPAALLGFLRSAEQSNAPVRFVDDVGVQHLVYITRTSERQVNYDGESERDTRLVDIAMIDAYTGLWIQNALGVEVWVDSVTFTLIDYTPAVWDTPDWDFFQWE